jgi:F-type H+-transporting ATPase subunit a
LETQTHRPWRRWVVLVLLIAGFILAGIYVPIAPEIVVAPEKLSYTPLFTLPVLGNFYLFNTIPTLIVTLILLVVIAFFTNRSLKRSEQSDLVPRGIGNVFESILEIFYNLTETSAGSKWAKTIFPWFATILIYVLFANLLKLLPGFESIGLIKEAHGDGGHAISALGASGWYLLTADKGDYVLYPFFRGISVDLNFTFSLALISVFMIQVIGVRALGLGYFSKFFNTRRMFKVPFFGAMDFLVGLLELISEIAKILSFAFRLFGVMFAGVVLVAIAASLMGGISIVPAMVLLFELFMGVLQAFVFGMLTMVFMAQATQGHGDEHAEGH